MSAEQDPTEIAKFQARINEFFVNNFLHSLVVENREKIITLDTNDTGINLTTSTLSIPLRGIEKHYGYDQQLSFDLNVRDIYDFHVLQSGKMDARTDINVKLYVHLEDRSELALDWDLIHARVSFNAIVTDMNIRAHITEINFDQVVQNLCTFGKVDLKMIKNLANTYFSDEEFEILSMLNSRLEHWLTLLIPSNFFGLFKLSNLTV